MKRDTLKLKIAVLALSTITAGNTFAETNTFINSMMDKVQQVFTSTFNIVSDFTDKDNKEKLVFFTKRMSDNIKIVNELNAQIKAELQLPTTKADYLYTQILQAIHDFCQQVIHTELSSLYSSLEGYRTSAAPKKVLGLAAILKTQLTRFNNAQNFEKRLNEIHSLLLADRQTKAAQDVKNLIATAYAKIEEIKKRVNADFLTILKPRI